jgi:hypothetical protein
MSLPLVDEVEQAVRAHLHLWHRVGRPTAPDLLAETVTATALHAVPDGWAKVKGTWVQLESYNDECGHPDCEHAFTRHGCEHVNTTWEYDEPWR